MLQSRLGPAERVLWLGSPKTGWRLLRDDPFVLIGAAIWALIVLGHEVVAPVLGIRSIGGALAVLTVLIGIRVLFEAHRRDNTYYFITNERVFIVHPRLGERELSLWLDHISTINLELDPDGSGTINLGQTILPGDFPAPGSRKFQQDPFVSLAHIENAGAVHDLLLEAKAGVQPREA